MNNLSLIKLSISNELIRGHFQYKLFLELVSALEQTVLVALASKPASKDKQQKPCLDSNDLFLHLLRKLVLLIS